MSWSRICITRRFGPLVSGVKPALDFPEMPLLQDGLHACGQPSAEEIKPASSVAWDDGYKLTSGRHAVSRSSTRVH
jgi:hypothetical protein